MVGKNWAAGMGFLATAPGSGISPRKKEEIESSFYYQECKFPTSLRLELEKLSSFRWFSLPNPMPAFVSYQQPTVFIDHLLKICFAWSAMPSSFLLFLVLTCHPHPVARGHGGLTFLAKCVIVILLGAISHF
ncbi:hypothetical protein D5086_017134 [Populus alba]|uniref:Uncharacterized protein n=1 Tax=Populus alba TaxID=43335 RepID=A0ACC4BX99_POPAL